MLTIDGPAPYAPAKTVMAVIDRHRQVNLTTVDSSTLMRMGVPDSLAPRTLQSLRILDLIDDEGHPASGLEALRLASSGDFRNVLADVIRAAYQPVFAVVDPLTAEIESIEDAFRRFTPHGQRSRMVTLFTGLLSEAGLFPEAPRKKPGPRALPRQSKPRLASTPTGKSASTVPAPTSEPTRVAYSPRPDGGDNYEIALRSGGSIWVNVDVNLFALSVEDRQYVASLIDLVKSYSDLPATKGATSSV